MQHSRIHKRVSPTPFANATGAVSRVTAATAKSVTTAYTPSQVEQVPSYLRQLAG